MKAKVVHHNPRSSGVPNKASDCVVRAIATAYGEPYDKIRAELEGLIDGLAARRQTKKMVNIRHRAARGINKNGIHPLIYKTYLENRGAKWVPMMHIGSGCQMHLREGEIPSDGTVILRVSKHLVTAIDGKLYDNHDPTRNGKRCVYGYWKVN